MRDLVSSGGRPASSDFGSGVAEAGGVALRPLEAPPAALLADAAGLRVGRAFFIGGLLAATLSGRG